MIFVRMIPQDFEAENYKNSCLCAESEICFLCRNKRNSIIFLKMIAQIFEAENYKNSFLEGHKYRYETRY